MPLETLMMIVLPPSWWDEKMVTIENHFQDDNKPEDQFISIVQSTVGKTTRIRLDPIQMRNGGVYEGEWKNGMRDG